MSPNTNSTSPSAPQKGTTVPSVAARTRTGGFEAGVDPDFDAISEDLEREFAALRHQYGDGE